MGYTETPFGLGPCHWNAFSLYSLSCPSKEKVLDMLFLGRVRIQRGTRRMQEKGPGAPCPEFIPAVNMIFLNVFYPFVHWLLLCKMWKIVTAASSCGSYENRWDHLHDLLRPVPGPWWSTTDMTYYYYCPSTSWSWLGWIRTKRHFNKIYPISVNPSSKWVSFPLY